MAFFFFYNNRKPRKFNHSPIYYNPQKDKQNDRVLKVKKEMGLISDEEYKSHIKGEFLRQTEHLAPKMRHNEEAGKSFASKNMTLLLILIILLIAGYFLFLR